MSGFLTKTLGNLEESILLANQSVQLEVKKSSSVIQPPSLLDKFKDHSNETSIGHLKPSKFDENIEDTIPVDIANNGSLIPDYNVVDKAGTIDVSKEVNDKSERGSENGASTGKKGISLTKRKNVQTLNNEENINSGTLKQRTLQTIEELNKDIDGQFGERIDIKTSGNKTKVVTVNPLILLKDDRSVFRPKRSNFIRFPGESVDSEESIQPRFLLHQPLEKHRRYVRFPPNGDFPITSSGARPSRPFGSWNPHFSFTSPSMVPRSPRLVFRDPLEHGTLQAPFFSQGNSLQDISGPEDNRGK